MVEAVDRRVLASADGLVAADNGGQVQSEEPCGEADSSGGQGDAI